MPDVQGVGCDSTFKFANDSLQTPRSQEKQQPNIQCIGLYAPVKRTKLQAQLADTQGIPGTRPAGFLFRGEGIETSLSGRIGSQAQAVATGGPPVLGLLYHSLYPRPAPEQHIRVRTC